MYVACHIWCSLRCGVYAQEVLCKTLKINSCLHDSLRLLMTKDIFVLLLYWFYRLACSSFRY